MSEWDLAWEKETKKEFNRTNKEKYASFVKLDRLISQSKANKIIEFGCGGGMTTLLSAKKLNFVPYLLDNSDAALRMARTNADILQVDASFIKADALSMPFEDGSFDFVWSGGVNEHFRGNERQKIFDEMARITKYGGVCVVTVPNKYYLPLNLFRFITQRLGMWEVGYEKPFSRKELKTTMEKAGLSGVEIQNTDFFIGFHFLFTLFLGRVPLLGMCVGFGSPVYRRFWNFLQYLDRKVTIAPGLGYVAYSEKK